MDLKQAHLIGTYLLLLLGSTSMWLGESAETFPYPLAVLVCSIAAYLFVDRWNILRLSQIASNGIALLILLLMVHELRSDSSTVLMALAHFLVYLQLAKSFRPKTDSDFWLMYMINALQVAVSCVINHRMAFGLLLLMYILLATFVLTLFYLRRHAERVHVDSRIPDPKDGSLVAVIGSIPRLSSQLTLTWIGCVLVALPIFWIVPRSAREQIRRRGLVSTAASQTAVTGFSESVSLDELQSVMESDEVVLNVWCHDRHGKPASLPANTLWRGVVLTTYHQRGWRGTPSMFAHQIRRLDRAPFFDDDQLELTVEQSRAAGHYLFAPRPVLWVQLDNPALVTFCERTEGRLFVRGPPEAGKRGVGSTSFKLRISTKDLQDDPSMASAITKDYADLTRKVPAHLIRLTELASELTSDLGDDEVSAKIDRVVAYLSDLTRFEYSLDLRPIDRSIDPVEDFLFNRKRGHCEYFASSAALLLRAAGVSTRIVNGFKGADFNDAGGFYQVPQLLAHAWVEAYDPGSQRWLTVDPTPGESRELGLARSRFLPAAVVNLLNLSSRIWDRYVMDFSALDQATFLTGIDFEKARDGLTKWIDRVPAFDLPGPSSLRLLVLFLALAAGVLLGVAGLRVVRRGFSFSGQIEAAGGPVFTDPSYDRWLDLLRRRGLVRLPSQTPLEFARAVEARLAEVPALVRWQGFPREMANCFYAGRYGAQPLDTADSRRLAKQINDFAKAAGEAWKE